MNAVEIEEAISQLVEEDFSRDEFPFDFLEAFGSKATTIKRLKAKKGSSNSSDIDGGVLLRSNLHLLACAEGEVTTSLKTLRDSPATKKGKAKFILATDGLAFEAEDIISGETVACDFKDFPNHFGFFLPLAGISTVKQISNNPVDIQATGRLNRLYVELLKENEDWSSEARRPDMNHFMARLIFCFFAEDTDIFHGRNLFSNTIEQMSGSRDGNIEHVIGELFRAMDLDFDSRKGADLPRWANFFPYVNGGLFSGNKEVPKFSRIARSYLLHAGNLDWRAINPDIFGSMIQAVTDDSERGSLGMHYTSVPNILKVLNPLFLDDLREQLGTAEHNPRKLLNLRKRISNIRVFDPACGSGNFLVIAYKEMRAIEFEINSRRGENGLKSELPLTNFRGIELKDFSAEIARLALIIAEYQCDFVYRGQKDALAEFLPLNAMNWITCGNALRLDWLSVCPPTGTAVKLVAEDLFQTPLDQGEIDFEKEATEIYICGNPPYYGGKLQTLSQKEDLSYTFRGVNINWKSLDYVAGWIYKSAQYISKSNAQCAIVSTNSICQGQQVPVLWDKILASDTSIKFAHTSFRWSNLATNNAVVTVIIIGLCHSSFSGEKKFYSTSNEDVITTRIVKNINPYLVAAPNVIVKPSSVPLNGLPNMVFGNMPRDAGHLILSSKEREQILSQDPRTDQFIYAFSGSEDFIHNKRRHCIWINDADKEVANTMAPISVRLKKVSDARKGMKAPSTQNFADRPHRFVQIQGVARSQSIIIPRHTSERREYLPVGLLNSRSIVADSALAIYDAPIWSLAIIASRLHWVWISTFCGKIKTDFRYSNTIGWNTFPVPQLTENNVIEMTRNAEEILLSRETHFPRTIAELYDPENMPENLQRAHDRNDEVLERIYIGRKFKNDTERLEKLFEFYEKSLVHH